MEDKLEEKLSEEKIKQIICCCEKLVDLENQERQISQQVDQSTTLVVETAGVEKSSKKNTIDFSTQTEEIVEQTMVNQLNEVNQSAIVQDVSNSS